MTTPGPIRVLVVDDSEFFAKMTADTLASEHGFDATHDVDAEAAMETLAGTDVDCIVSDYEMPGMDGIEFLDAVQKTHGDLPFILLTGRGDEEVASEAIEAGVSDYLLKLEVVEDEQYERLANRIESVVASHRTQTKYERLFEDFPDVIATASANGTVLAANPAMAALLDADEAALVGESLTDVFPDDVGQKRLDLGRAALEAGETRRGEDAHDGRTFRTIAVPVEGTGGDDSFHLIAQDITERKRRETELQRQNERLESFTSVVSHDLRNPLNVAQSSVDLLQTELEDSSHLDRLDRSLTRMNDIIEDVLTLARQDDSVSDPSPVDLSTMADEAWSLVDADDVDLEVIGTRRFRADSSRLTDLLGNLFQNSLDHGSGADLADDDRTTVVRVEPLDDGFFVADDGPGIPESERDQVFDVGFSTAREGTGLGLNIVQAIASAHGWDIALTDSDAGGARFEFTGVTDP